MSWFVYLIECRGGSVYTGITTDVDRRYAQHVAGTGARYTRARPPVRLLGSRAFPDRSSASKAEYAVKQLPPERKRRWCIADPGALPDPLTVTKGPTPLCADLAEASAVEVDSH